MLRSRQAKLKWFSMWWVQAGEECEGLDLKPAAVLGYSVTLIKSPSLPPAPIKDHITAPPASLLPPGAVKGSCLSALYKTHNHTYHSMHTQSSPPSHAPPHTHTSHTHQLQQQTAASCKTSILLITPARPVTRLTRHLACSAV